MRLVLKRVYKKSTYTIGRLFVDSVLFSNTLEDAVRDYSNPNFKVYGKTAIPYGEYKITLEYSPKFSPKYDGRLIPYLHDVPGFSGILIHPGNDAEDTEGCILVGMNTSKGWISQSRDTFLKLLAMLEKVPDSEEIYISIEP